jgi:uncharacterized membrane protein YkgB
MKSIEVADARDKIRSDDDPVQDRRVELLSNVGVRVLRYGLVFFLLTYGSFKFFAFEAEAIRPLVENSPFLAWLYPILGFRVTSAVIGVFEVTAGLLIALRRWVPRISAYGSLAAVPIFVVTLSFLLTTPGALSLMHPLNGFLLKDIMLLGAALFTAAEALRNAA